MRTCRCPAGCPTSRPPTRPARSPRPGGTYQVQPFWQLGVMARLQRRAAVVGNGIPDVGNQTPARNPNQPIAGPLAQSEGSSELRIDKHPQTGTIGICGAMSLQRGDSGRGNESVPQKLVHLVGCRVPNVQPETWVGPQPTPAKRRFRHVTISSLNELA